MSKFRYTKKDIAVILSKLGVFDKPKVRFEQYLTDSECAADILWNAYMLGDIEGKDVADYGCGTGILGIGALLLGAKSVRFVEIDANALEIAKNNFSRLKSEGLFECRVEFVLGDIANENTRVHTIFSNPPFGTRNEGADAAFLEKASTLGTITHTFHKSSTNGFIENKIAMLGGKITHIWDIDLPLKRTYSHHTKRIERIKVSVYRAEFAPGYKPKTERQRTML